MIQMINKLKKNQKGFTLVELIVVLVILAILAAFTIPAMLGFVDDARGKAAVSQGREIYVAAQSAGTEIAAGHSGTLESSRDAGAIMEKVQNLVGDDIEGMKGTTNNPNVIVEASSSFGDETPHAANSAYISMGTTGSVNEVRYTDSSNKYTVKITPSDNGTSAEIIKNNN